MSQTNVKNYFLQFNTEKLIPILSLPDPPEDDILGYITIYGPGVSPATGPSIKEFLIELVKGQDVNITLMPINLTTADRIFFNSNNNEAPFRIKRSNNNPNKPLKSSYFNGNFHNYAVTMHLTATHKLETTSNITFDILLIPAGKTVTEGYNFVIDPQLQIKQPSNP
ncbi:MAG: hypothetical protein R8G66_26300 [Cytophagales bacterium]|nr:hypothetical protein [Cytophagales bacterium]